jgi:hypothetical protein
VNNPAKDKENSGVLAPGSHAVFLAFSDWFSPVISGPGAIRNRLVLFVPVFLESILNSLLAPLELFGYALVHSMRTTLCASMKDQPKQGCATKCATNPDTALGWMPHALGGQGELLEQMCLNSTPPGRNVPEPQRTGSLRGTTDT